MTEQQIKQLKSLLDDNDNIENSTELDQAILTAAHAKAGQLATEKPSWFSVFPFGPISAAGLSVSLTLGLLFGLGTMLSSNDSLSPPLESQNYALDFNDTEHTQNEDNKSSEVAVKRPTDTTEPYGIANRTLDKGELPSTDHLLSHMTFSIASDRSNAQEAIDVAMLDIRFMLHEGQLDQARERYTLLVSTCTTCKLPETLDALLTETNSHTDSG